MSEKHALTPSEISKIVDGFDPIDWDEMEMMAKLPPGQRILAPLRKTEMVRSDLRNKLMEDFPEFSKSEINMKVLRSFTPVRMGKLNTEPPYFASLG